LQRFTGFNKMIFLWAATQATYLSAEVVHKKDGGRVEGEIIPDKSDDHTLFLKTSFGTVEIHRDEIERIDSSTDPLDEYKQRRKNAPATPDGQFELALWCLEEKLHTQYREHLDATLKLDPNHPQARKKLGYVQSDGAWITEDEARSKEGYVKYRGKWVLPQERAQKEADRSKDSRRQDFGRRIRLAQKGLRQTDKPERVQAAMSDLFEIDDPAAIPLLMSLLGQKGTDADRAVLVEVLRRIAGDESTSALVRISLEDPLLAHRSASVDALLPRKNPPLVGKFVKELKSNDNDHVRRAAFALQTLGDESVVAALVEALITKHERVYDPSFEEKLAGITGTSVRTTETVILPDGTMIRRNLLQGQTPQQAFAPNVPQRQVIVETKQNEEVLDTLMELTGENFGFNQNAWRQWLDSEYRDDAARKANAQAP
jgi:hypothetical protein